MAGRRWINVGKDKSASSEWEKIIQLQPANQSAKKAIQTGLQLEEGQVSVK
ncbi:hypothetical protein OnM2_025109 [Erysiphe neolycopersici]|uniref:Uncharacterized protein n=1 Tax=Erysiphe neolycopersici TaxID=212602 RepID=A0A420I1B5_9PEZI|nr:hypothetical protein OnM2_025109 [Erysiphe neolycopersici]